MTSTRRADARVHLLLLSLSDDPAAAQTSTRSLARRVNLSESRLRHLFQQHTGMSLNQFRKQKRLETARTLLKSTFKSVKEIAFAVGAKDHSHFVRDFKAMYGQTPTQYRRSE